MLNKIMADNPKTVPPAGGHPPKVSKILPAAVAALLAACTLPHHDQRQADEPQSAEDFAAASAQAQQAYRDLLENIFDPEDSALTVNDLQDALLQTWNTVVQDASGKGLQVKLGDAIFIQDPTANNRIVSESVYWLRIAAGVHNAGADPAAARDFAIGMIRGLEMMTELANQNNSANPAFPAWAVRVEDGRLLLDPNSDGPENSASDADLDYVMSLLAIRNNLQTGVWAETAEFNLQFLDNLLLKLIEGLEEEFSFSNDRYVLQPSEDWTAAENFHPDYNSPETCFAIAAYLDAAGQQEDAAVWQKRGRDAFDFLMATLDTCRDEAGHSYIPETAIVTVEEGGWFKIIPQGKQAWECRGSERIAAALPYVLDTLTAEQLKLLEDYLLNWHNNGQGYTVPGLDAAMYLPLAVQLNNFELAREIVNVLRGDMGADGILYKESHRYYQLSLIGKAVTEILSPYLLLGQAPVDAKTASIIMQMKSAPETYHEVKFPNPHWYEKFVKIDGGYNEGETPRLGMAAFAEDKTYSGSLRANQIGITSVSTADALLAAVNENAKAKFTALDRGVQYFSMMGFAEKRVSKLLPREIIYDGNFRVGNSRRGVYSGSSDSRADLKILAAYVIAAQKGWLDDEQQWFLAVYLTEFLSQNVGCYVERQQQIPILRPLLIPGNERVVFWDDKIENARVYELNVAAEDQRFLEILRDYCAKPGIITQRISHINIFNPDGGYLQGHSDWHALLSGLVESAEKLRTLLGRDGTAFFAAPLSGGLALLSENDHQDYKFTELPPGSTGAIIPRTEIKTPFDIGDLRLSDSAFGVLWDNFLKRFGLGNFSTQYDKRYAQEDPKTGHFPYEGGSGRPDLLAAYRAPRKISEEHNFATGVQLAMSLEGQIGGLQGMSIFEQTLYDAALNPEQKSGNIKSHVPKAISQILPDGSLNAVDEYIWGMLYTTHGFTENTRLIGKINERLAAIAQAGGLRPDNPVVRELHWQKLLLWDELSPYDKWSMREIAAYYEWTDLYNMLLNPPRGLNYAENFKLNIEGQEIDARSLTKEKLFAMKISDSAKTLIFRLIVAKKELQAILKTSTNRTADLEKYLDSLPADHLLSALSLVFFSRAEDGAAKLEVDEPTKIWLVKKYLTAIDCADKDFSVDNYLDIYTMLANAYRLILADAVYAALDKLTTQVISKDGSLTYPNVTPDNVTAFNNALFRLASFIDKTRLVDIDSGLNFDKLTVEPDEKYAEMLKLFEAKRYGADEEYKSFWRDFENTYKQQEAAAGLLDDLFWPGSILKSLADEDIRLHGENPDSLIQAHYADFGRQLYELAMVRRYRNKYGTPANVRLQVVIERMKTQKVYDLQQIGASLDELHRLQYLAEIYNLPDESAKIQLAEAAILAISSVSDKDMRYGEIRQDPAVKNAPSYIQNSLRNLEAQIVPTVVPPKKDEVDETQEAIRKLRRELGLE